MCQNSLIPALDTESQIAKRYQSIKERKPQQEFKVNHIVLFFIFHLFIS